MKILLSGGTGFLGQKLALRLIKEGATVTILKRKSSVTLKLDCDSERVAYHDIDQGDLSEVFNYSGIFDLVIHAATCYGRADENYSYISYVNTQLPLRLLELSMRFGVDAFVNVDTVLNPKYNSYSLSKHHFVEWAENLSRKKVLKFVNVRLENLFGPGEEKNSFVSLILRQCIINKSEIRLTKGIQKRDFIYIDDAVEGFITLVNYLDRLKKGFNEIELGSGRPISIKELAQTIHRLTRSKSTLRFGEVDYLSNELMWSKAKTHFLSSVGWRCKTNIEEGIRKMIEDIET